MIGDMELDISNIQPTVRAGVDPVTKSDGLPN